MKEPSFLKAFSGMIVLISLAIIFTKNHHTPQLDHNIQIKEPKNNISHTPTVVRQEPIVEERSYRKDNISQVNHNLPSPGSNTQDHQDETPGLLAQAVSLLDGGNPQEAEKILKDILEKDPSNENAITELGMLYLIDYKDGEKAKPYLEKSLELHPESRVILSELMHIYKESENPNEGVEFLQSLHQRNPDQKDVSQALGDILLDLGRAEESAKMLSGVIEQNGSSPQNVDVLSRYAQALSESGQKEGALEAHKKILDFELEQAQKNPKDESAQEKIIKARMEIIGDYMDMKEEDKAKEELAKTREELGEEAYQKLIEGIMAKK